MSKPSTSTVVDVAVVQEYRALKLDLLRRSGGRPYDAADKRQFVRRVLADAGVHLRDDLHVDR